MHSIFFGLIALAAGLATPIAAIGAAIGEGFIFASAIQSIARQPELEKKITQLMFITFGIVEALVFIAGFFMWASMKGMIPPDAAHAVDQITITMGH